MQVSHLLNHHCVNMQSEIEAKILEINKEKIRDVLASLGAKKVFDERLFKRATFDNELLRSQNAWVRLRDEGDKITLTLKQVGDPTVITSVKEVLFEVSDFDTAMEFLQTI